MDPANTQDYVISAHAQRRWAERRPNKDIRSSLASARLNSYHPIAARSIANYSGINPNRYCLVADTGEVFVIEQGGGRRTLITVLVAEKTLCLNQDAFESMNEQELRRAITSIEGRQIDLKGMIKQLSASRLAAERRLALIKRQNKQH